jgi:hypothetical protein
MRSILIDPFTRTVTEVEYTGDYKQIYDLIDCDTYDVARINQHGDGIFVDDEGLFKEQEQKFFLHEDYPQPLAGKGLVLGCDMETGESVEPHDSVMDVAAKVRWVVPVRINGEVAWVPAMFADMGLLQEQA